VTLCLSYCWGKSQALRTTKATQLAYSTTGIPRKNIPKTFCDIFRLAQMLKVRYVWIDSLCIVQDDPQDWTIQAAKMSEIYGKSYLTISAASAADPTKDCTETFMC
jgi:hypothetical protein